MGRVKDLVTDNICRRLRTEARDLGIVSESQIDTSPPSFEYQQLLAEEARQARVKLGLPPTDLLTLYKPTPGTIIPMHRATIQLYPDGEVVLVGDQMHPKNSPGWKAVKSLAQRMWHGPLRKVTIYKFMTVK